MPIPCVRATLTPFLALAGTACQPPTAAGPGQPADVKVRGLAADDAAATLLDRLPGPTFPRRRRGRPTSWSSRRSARPAGCTSRAPARR